MNNQAQNLYKQLNGHQAFVFLDAAHLPKKDRCKSMSFEDEFLIQDQELTLLGKTLKAMLNEQGLPR